MIVECGEYAMVYLYAPGALLLITVKSHRTIMDYALRKCRIKKLCLAKEPNGLKKTPNGRGAAEAL